MSVRNRASLTSSSASATRTSLVTSSRLEVQVHGNLNDREMAAIKDVLGQVETLADKFFGGDVQAAIAASAALHIDSTQLASVDLELASRLRISGVAIGSTTPVAESTRI